MPMFGGLEPRRGLASDSDLNRDAAKGSPCLTSRAVEFFHCGNLSKSSQLVLGALNRGFMVNFRSRPLSVQENREYCTSQPLFLEQLFLTIWAAESHLKQYPNVPTQWTDSRGAIRNMKTK